MLRLCLSFSDRRFVVKPNLCSIIVCRSKFLCFRVFFFFVFFFLCVCFFLFFFSKQARGYKAVYVFNSAEHGNFFANKYENANNIWHCHIY